ncbi:MAG TPA: hypothetical protein VGN01_04615 [Acidobacteriaceae bacterium]|jgi:hypothetical protein
MNKDEAENLLILIGELVYKNQSLREAVASKDETIELIINHLSAATSACPCGVAKQLTFVRTMVAERDRHRGFRTLKSTPALQVGIEARDGMADRLG